MSNVKRAKTVKDLIAILQQCNPDATVIVSEKPGRGAAQCFVYQGFTNDWGEELAPEQEEGFTIPAVEVTADL